MFTQSHADDIGRRLHRFSIGKRYHDQATYFCGTSLCLAGDKIVDDFCEHKGYSLDKFNSIYAHLLTGSAKDCLPAHDEFVVFIENGIPDNVAFNSIDSEWNYAQHAWQLSYEEAELLFSGNLCLDRMIANLEIIAANHSLAIPGCLQALKF